MLRILPKCEAMPPIPADLRGLDIPEKLLALLVSRGFQSRRDIERYLKPQREHLHDPFLMQDMDKAVALLRETLQKQEKICIFGDYDVDGVTATSILLTYLRKEENRLHGTRISQSRVSYYIPDRHGEGYGLNSEAIRKIAAEGNRLLVTVDCGISCRAEVALARELGMKVIVSDHHQLPDALPECEAVLDPLLGNYPFRYLCGAGVAFKIVSAMGGAEATSRLWDLAALATVADIVPLVDENRVLVYYGLQDMERLRRPGLLALQEIVGVREPLSSSDIAYRLAPRINAGGRLALAGRGVELLTTRNPERARQLAQELEEHNDKRKQLEGEIYHQALEMIEGRVDLTRDRVLVVCGQGWETGVIGLVASRLVERYHWPAVVLSSDGKKCTGSCRSIPGVNLFEMLHSCEHLLIRYGGHAQAAGLTVLPENVDALREALSRVISQTTPAEAFIPREEYDLEVSAGELTLEFAQAFSGMQPTGYGNPEPVFRLSNASLTELRPIGRTGAHLRMRLVQDDQKSDAIWFRMGDQLSRIPDHADVLFTLCVNEWNNQKNVQCQVRAMVPTAPQKAFRQQVSSRQEEVRQGLVEKLADYPCNGTEAAPVTRMTMMEAQRAIPGWTRESLQGTVFCANTAQFVLMSTAEIAVLLANEEIDYSLFTPADSRGFNAFVLAPRWRDFPFKPRRVVFLEPPFCPAEISEVSTLFNPEIVQVELRDLRRAFAAEVTPDMEQLRDLYRKLRQGGAADLAALAQDTDLLPGAALSGLWMMKQAGLLHLRQRPFEVRTIEGARGNPGQSSLFRILENCTHG